MRRRRIRAGLGSVIRRMRHGLATRVALVTAAAGATLVVRAVLISRPPLSRVLDRSHRPARVRLVDPPGGTVLDERGAARSVQAADLTVPVEALETLWSLGLPERLGTTYWQHIERLFAGLLRVRTGPGGAAILPLGLRPLALMRFAAPEHTMSATSAAVRWPIAGGLLVARAGGALEIVAKEHDCAKATATLHVRVGMEGFRPTVARLLSERAYLATQARVHVWVTHGYLRGLERPDLLARARPGRRAGGPVGAEELPSAACA